MTQVVCCARRSGAGCEQVVGKPEVIHVEPISNDNRLVGCDRNCLLSTSLTSVIPIHTLKLKKDKRAGIRLDYTTPTHVTAKTTAQAAALLQIPHVKLVQSRYVGSATSYDRLRDSTNPNAS